MPWTGGFGLELDSNGLQRCRLGRACGIVLPILMSVNSQRHRVFPTSFHQFTTDICADRWMNLSKRRFRMYIVDSHMFSISWERRSVHYGILLSLLKIEQDSAAFCVSGKRNCLLGQFKFRVFDPQFHARLKVAGFPGFALAGRSHS